MMRLIDAVKYRKMLEEEIAFSEENGKEECVYGLEIAVAGLMDAPTIDPETLAEHLRSCGYEVRKCQH